MKLFPWRKGPYEIAWRVALSRIEIARFASALPKLQFGRVYAELGGCGRDHRQVGSETRPASGSPHAFTYYIGSTNLSDRRPARNTGHETDSNWNLMLPPSSYQSTSRLAPPGKLIDTAQSTASQRIAIATAAPSAPRS